MRAQENGYGVESTPNCDLVVVYFQLEVFWMTLCPDKWSYLSGGVGTLFSGLILGRLENYTGVVCVFIWRVNNSTGTGTLHIKLQRIKVQESMNKFPLL